MMTRLIWGSIKTKSAIFLAALMLLILTSTVIAGTGVGAVFNLGRSNSVNALSILTGSTSARMLQVTNTNTGNGAGALAALNNSLGASTIRAQNNGNGPALGLFVNANIPPMVVNSPARVTNLHADLLDGQDASAFLPVNATAVDSRMLGGIPSNGYVGGILSKAESAVESGTALSDGTHVLGVSCPDGSLLLSGGPANINSTSTVLESFPSTISTWAVRIQKNGFADNFSVVALCASRG